MAIISGTVYDANGSPAGGRIIRVYRRDTGTLLAKTVSSDGSPIDPHYSLVTLLIHCDGPEGSTTFEDSSQYQRTIVPAGNAKITLADAKFSGSLLLDGSGDYLSISQSNDFAFGTGDFTVETYVRFTSLRSSRLLTNRETQGGASGTWALNINPTSFGFTEVIVGEPGIMVNYAWETNTWYHIAVSRVSGILYLFVNGTLVGSGSFTRNLSNASYNLHIGTSPNETYVHGMMDEIRITKGLGRYVSNFTLPSAPFPNRNESLPVGQYKLNVNYSGEVNVLFLDDNSGDIYNDIVHRVLL